MRMFHQVRILGAGLALALLALSCAQPGRSTGPGAAPRAGTASTPRSLAPEDVAAIRGRLHALVDTGRFAGLVTLIQQHGRIVDLDAYGLADSGTGAPMRADSVMAIASMTKPITGVALMMLYEQHRWSLDDPVAKFVPEFADLKVMDANGQLVAPQHMPTMRELMSHSAGFTYGFFGSSPVDLLYQHEQPLAAGGTLQSMIGKLARLPLKHQPGSAWEYSVSVDIQGCIVERLSGMPFDVFLREKIFRPLKMIDTDFAVFGAARTRLAYPHAPGPDGRLAPVLPDGGRDAFADRLPSLPSPGGGLYSTAHDYARFAQMLLNGGSLDGVRLLEPATVALMHRNALPTGIYVGPPGSRTGFGLDFAIAPDPALSHEPWPAGTYYWSGIYGTYFWIDPANELIVVGMVQRAWRPGEDARATLEARDAAGRAVYARLPAQSRISAVPPARAAPR
ncbi:MAG: beta-lactamase family protein [Gammaproteobacteria bacterium]|nr:beta-lactamase family protein [Gammaproteobacteria bacterium]